jgi:hypothetical protein
MTIDEFMDDVIAGWKADHNTVATGSRKALVKKWYDAYGEEYSKATHVVGRKLQLYGSFMGVNAVLYILHRLIRRIYSITNI